MSNITFNNKNITALAEETVLEVILRSGEQVQFSCRKGSCQTCLMKTEDYVSSKSQEGLSQNLIDKNYFMPCVCIPESDMNVTSGNKADFFYPAKVVEKNSLSHNTIQIKLELESDFQYAAGQYIYIKYHNSDETRPYSIASLPMVEKYLELHIKKVEQGKFSTWIFNDLNIGDKIEIQNAVGDCKFNSTYKYQNILLIGTGTGLAPLYGIIRDALLLNDHQGYIYLYHGASSPRDLYFKKELRALNLEYANFHYYPCVSGKDNALGYQEGRANTIAFNSHKELAGWKVYLCGNPDMVKEATNAALSFGVFHKDINTDAFDYQYSLKNENQKLEREDVKNSDEFKDERARYSKPELEM